MIRVRNHHGQFEGLASFAENRKIPQKATKKRRKMAKKRGVRRGKPVFSSQLQAAARRLKTTREIAAFCEKHVVSHRVVWKWRHDTRLTEREIGFITGLRDSGRTLREICDQTGRSRTSVVRAMSLA